VRFKSIREHAGSQRRAWEELTYQVAHDLDDLPPWGLAASVALGAASAGAYYKSGDRGATKRQLRSTLVGGAFGVIGEDSEFISTAKSLRT
jgi:hypothetical protein